MKQFTCIVIALITLISCSPVTAQPVVTEVVTIEQFQKELQEATTPIFVDFYATWCGPCNRLSPFVETWAQTYQGKIRFLKVNVDQVPLLSQQYQVKAMPTMLLFTKNGDLANRKVGYDIYQLMNQIEKNETISATEINDLLNTQEAAR